MRVVIYGAGAVGSVMGGYLGRFGHDVVLIGRPGHVTAINEHGLRLVTPTGTNILRLPSVTGPDQIDFRLDDVAFFCVKGQNTEEAIRDLRAMTEDVPIFCIQNGVRNEEIAARYFPRVYGVMAGVRAAYLTDGEVVARDEPPGRLVIGRYPQGTDELAKEVAKKLRTSGFSVMLTPDIMPYKWGKLMANLANAIHAITNVRGKEDVDFIARAARQEFRDTLIQAGIGWISLEDLAEEWPEITLPPRGSLDMEAQGSTWQSLTRRQGSVETEFLNGEVVRLAKKLGQRAPINEELLRISEEMAANRETPGKYTPNQLCALLGL